MVTATIPQENVHYLPGGFDVDGLDDRYMMT